MTSTGAFQPRGTRSCALLTWKDKEKWEVRRRDACKNQRAVSLSRGMEFFFMKHKMKRNSFNRRKRLSESTTFSVYAISWYWNFCLPSPSCAQLSKRVRSCIAKIFHFAREAMFRVVVPLISSNGISYFSFCLDLNFANLSRCLVIRDPCLLETRLRTPSLKSLTRNFRKFFFLLAC